MDKLNLTELKALAKESGLKGYSVMSKPALLSHLNKGGAMGGYGDLENFNYFNVDQLRTYVKGINPKTPVSKLNQNELIEMAQGKKDVPVKPKREGNTWVKALKQYNSGKDTYTIPKKGSAAYDEVKAIMNGKPVAKPKKTRKAKQEEVLYL